MARCPKCGNTLSWLKLLKSNKTELLNCQICGSMLAIDSQQSTILIGGLIAILFLPETNLLPFELNIEVWFLIVFAIYIPFYLRVMKLNVISDGELDITPNQASKLEGYAKGRRHFNLLGNLLLWGGLLFFLAGISFSTIQSSDLIPALGLFSATIGLIVRSLTKCPFCKHVTIIGMFNTGGRCINCHREIDIDE